MNTTFVSSDRVVGVSACGSGIWDIGAPLPRGRRRFGQLIMDDGAALGLFLAYQTLKFSNGFVRCPNCIFEQLPKRVNLRFVGSGREHPMDVSAVCCNTRSEERRVGKECRARAQEDRRKKETRTT